MNNTVFRNIEGILFDLDGVVHVGDSPIPGAADTLRHLRAKGIPFRFLTNTTTKTPERLCQKMSSMGLQIEQHEIFTTHEVAVRYLRQQDDPLCFLLVSEDARASYAEFRQTDSTPEYVVIGDIGDRWNYEILNNVFNMVMAGSRMLALHKGRYWRTGAGLVMDIGAFVAGLEYTTGTEAIVIGKPAAAFFDMAIKDLGVPKKGVIMVGDDIESDVGGAQNAGIRGVLVETGKYRDDTLRKSTVRPAAVIKSVAELARLI